MWKVEVKQRISPLEPRLASRWGHGLLPGLRRAEEPPAAARQGGKPGHAARGRAARGRAFSGESSRRRGETMWEFQMRG